MIILGLLLILGIAGLSVATLWANTDMFTTGAGTIDLFGSQLTLTVGQVFLAGVVAGALVLTGLAMVLSGLGRSARRRSTARHQLRDHREEMQDLKRQHDATSSDLAARRAASEELAAPDQLAARH